MEPNEGIFRHTSVDVDVDHGVPVDNFLNTQCIFDDARNPELELIETQTSAQSPLGLQNSNSRSS